MTKWVAFLLAAIVHGSGSAEIYRGQHIADWSQAFERIQAGTSRSGDHQDAARLLGYVAGVADSSVAVQILCIQSGVTVGQLMSMTSKYVRENPDKWQETANNTVFAALHPTFKCN